MKRSSRLLSTSTIVITAAALAVAGKLGAFGKDVILSYYFGLGTATDAYFIANVLPGLVWLSVFSTIAAVFLPWYAAQRKSSVAAAALLAQEATRVYLMASTGLTLLCIVFAGPIVWVTAPEASADTLVLARQLTVIMAVGFIFTGYVGLQNAIQQANGQFLPPLIAPVANNLLSMAAIALAAWVGSVHLAVVGAVLGWAVQAPLQRWLTLRYHPPRWRWKVRPETLRRLSVLSAPVMLGVLLDQVNIYVGMAVAGRLGPGAISHLSYAARLAMFLATVFSWLVAYLLYPRLAALAARRDDPGVGRTLSIGLFLIAATTVPVLIVAISLSESFVGFIFGRGAFDAADVTETAAVFSLYALGALFISTREMINRVFFSYQRTGPPLIIGAAALAVNVVAAILLGRTLGVAGVALAASLSAMVYAVLQFGWIGIWKPVLLQLDLGKLLGTVAMAGVVCLVITAVLGRRLEDLPDFARLVMVGAGGGLAYLVVLAALLRFLGFHTNDLRGLLTRS